MFRPVCDPPERPTDDAIVPAFLTRAARVRLRRIVHAHREGWLLRIASRASAG